MRLKWGRAEVDSDGLNRLCNFARATVRIPGKKMIRVDGKRVGFLQWHGERVGYSAECHGARTGTGVKR